MNAQQPWRMTREQAIISVQRLMDAKMAEAEFAQLLERTARGLACPHVANYILWDSDPDQAAEKIVDRALAYKPIAL